VRFFATRRREARGEVVVGHHNRNHILPLGQPLAYLLDMESGRVRAKFRVPYETVEVVPRIWRESEVLRVVSGQLNDVPRCLADFGEWSLHGYVEGSALAEENPDGPIGEERMTALAGFFAQLADVPADALPERPADWPADGDSQGFLHRLARFAEEEVNQPNRSRFGRLFDAVGVPVDVVDRFLRTAPPLVRRPFVLLHTDVHRANVVVARTPDGERLSVLDWELSLYGDPLHDLATHVVRMGYDETEQKLMIELWADAMRQRGHAPLTAGMERDLRTYLRFERVQSVFPDVLRAALALPEEPTPEDFQQAADRVRGALDLMWSALEPTGETMDEIVDEPVVVQALRRWHAEDGATRLAARSKDGGNGWCPDADLPRGLGRTPRRGRDRDADRDQVPTDAPDTGRGPEPHRGPGRAPEAWVQTGEPLVEGLERHVC
jgi:aminoglycoside phosphotransferase (APT) family kinase protein